jgi:MYXO-CTERM domain-containing protein
VTGVQTCALPILAGADTAQPTFTSPSALGASPLTFRLTVTDTLHGLASSAEVNVVGLVNHAPVATAGADQTVAPGATVSLDATGSTDADLDPLHFAWTQVDGPAVVLGGAATAMSGFTAPSLPSESVLHLRVTVSDGLASSSADVTVTVQAVPPQASGSRSGCGCGAGAGDPLGLLGLGLAAALRRRRGA